MDLRARLAMADFESIKHMTVARIAACLVASAFVIAACSRPAGDMQATSARAADPASHASATSETSMPDMRPGLWEVTIDHGDGRSHGAVTRQCLDAAAMAQAKLTTADYVKANCSKNVTQHAMDTWTNDLVCKNGGGVTITHTVTALAGDGGYHASLSTTYDPPLAGSASSATTVDGKWISAC
jgi:hypothetical protein